MPTIRHTPLFLALLAPFCALAQSTDDAANTTHLAPVQVKASTHHDAHGSSANAYGDASIHDTPAAISVVSRQQLDDRQIRNLSELAREDASLGDSYAPVGYYQDVAIRGYPLDLATGIRFNNLTIAGEQEMALEDKQSVEVLKGLAGLNAGVMEPGGLINYVTKRPEDVQNVTVGTDSHGSRYTALDVGGWLTPNFGLRANLAYEDTHSYVEHANGRRNFYSIAADWRITDKATLELDSDYQASAQRSVSGYQLLGGTVIPSDADATRLLGYEPWQQPVSVHASNTSARFNYAFDDNWLGRVALGHSRTVIDDNVAFAYGCFYEAECGTSSTPGAYFAPNGNYDIYDWRSPDDTRVDDTARISLEGSVDTFGLSNDLTFGVQALHRTMDQRQYVYDFVGVGNIDQGNPPYYPESPDQPGTPQLVQNSWQRSVFALDRLHLNEQWQVLFGGSYVWLNESDYDLDSGALVTHTLLEHFLPQAAVLWQPNSALTTYISYSQGLSLGQQAPYWTSNSGDVLGPRLSRQLEIGAKEQLNEHLNVSAALFRISQPYQFGAPSNTDAGFTFVQQGQQQNTGLELNADGQLSQNLHLLASVTYIHARAEDTGVAEYDDHQLANVPKTRFSLHADYRLPWLPAVTVLGGWRYASPNVATPTGDVRVPAYNVFDAGLNYSTRWGQHAVTWRLSIDNLFDKFYWRDTGDSGGDSYLFPGAPRLARLSVTFGL